MVWDREGREARLPRDSVHCDHWQRQWELYDKQKIESGFAANDNGKQVAVFEPGSNVMSHFFILKNCQTTFIL